MSSGQSDVATLVRQLVNDKDADTYTAGEVEAALNLYRWEGRYLELSPLPSYAEGGAATYTTFEAPSKDWRYWDTTATFYDNDYTAITPATTDYTNGRWTFSSEPDRPVKILGYSYDPYATAAYLLEQRAAQLAEDIQSFAVHNGSFTYANKRSGPLELAAKYRKMARDSQMQAAAMYRDDVNIF